MSSPFIPPMSNWMEHADQTLPLSALSIPGTHDSAADTYAPSAGTQELTITEQLNQGIRFFDLRITFKYSSASYIPFTTPKGFLQLVHGVFPLRPLEPVLREMYTWLDNHLKEGLVVQFKQDGTLDSLSQTQFTNMFFAIFDTANPNSTYWRLDNTIPTITQLQKRIQLIRRIDLPVGVPGPKGLDVTNWTHNSPDFSIPPAPPVSTPSSTSALSSGFSNPPPPPTSFAQPTFRIQDYYDLINVSGGINNMIDQKYQKVEKFMQYAASDTTGTWFFNYASAQAIATDPLTLLTPYKCAQGYVVNNAIIAVTGTNTPPPKWEYGVNRKIVDYLNGLTSKKPCGTIMLDFPNGMYSTTLISQIVLMNNLKP